MFSGKKKSRAQYDRIEVEATHDGAETEKAEAEAREEARTAEEGSAASKDADEPKTKDSSAADASANTSVSENVDTSEDVNTQKAEQEQEEEDPDAMTLNVKGTDDKTHKVRISENASVTDLKAKIASITEFGVERQRLIFLGKMLDDALKLCDYNIKDGNFIHLVPKPAGFVAPSSDENGSNGTGENGEASINLHDIPIGLFRESGAGYNPQLGYDREYIQTLNLELWRARIRLLSSLMLFYYFLQFMTNLSFWLHPKQANFQFEDNHHPTDLYFAVDAVENIGGMIVAWCGLKTAADDSTILSKRFFVLMCRLCIVHFVSLAVYSKQLLSGQIVIKTMRHANGPRDAGELGVSVLFNIMINIMIWATCIGVASRYHGELEYLQAQRAQSENNNTRGRRQRRRASTDEETPMENPTVVVVQ